MFLEAELTKLLVPCGVHSELRIDFHVPAIVDPEVRGKLNHLVPAILQRRASGHTFVARQAMSLSISHDVDSDDAVVRVFRLYCDVGPSLGRRLYGAQQKEEGY